MTAHENVIENPELAVACLPDTCRKVDVLATDGGTPLQDLANSESERLLHQTISQLRSSRTALEARVEQLEQLVEQRSKSLAAETARRQEVEEEAHASEQRYRAMVEGITDYIVTIGGGNNCSIETTHSSGCVAVTGYTSAEFRDNPYLWIDIVAEEDRDFVRSRAPRTLAERDAEPFEHRIVRKDGCVRWVRHTPVLLIDNHGAVIGCDSLIQDVTARKLAELKLRANEDRLALTLHGGNFATWDWDMVSGQVEHNQRWTQMLGYSRDELESNHSTWQQLIHPDDQARVLDVLAAHLRGETISFESRYRLHHKSGRWVWVLDRGRVTLRDEQGRPLRVSGTNLDITESRQTEERLRVTQFSVDKSPEMILWLDANAQVQYVNEATCKLLGLASEEMVGTPVWSFCSEWPEKKSLSESSCLASNGSRSFCIEFHHKDGTVIPVEVTVNELQYDGREYCCVSGRDIRGRIQAMAALTEARTKAEEATRAKSEFLATMGHEIRTPLTAIIGYANALRRCGDLSRAPVRRFDMLAAIERNGNHLLELIRDMLDLSRVEAGRLDLSCASCSLLEIVLEVAANLQERAQAKGLAFFVQCATDIPREIVTDPGRLRQIVTNLAGNAIKFTDEGHVTIRLRVQSDPAEQRVLFLEVEDTGIGVPSDKMSVIFEPFTHGHDPQVHHTTGTGLGLTICRRLAASLGGDIALTSNVGQGSTFTFTLPLPGDAQMWRPTTADLDTWQANCAAREVPHLNLAKTRILVIDDTPDARNLLTYLLSEAGAEVSAAPDGMRGVDVALEATRTGSGYDLILMDMRMPGLDGYAATRKLREEGLRSPIIALTAYAMKDDKQKCLDAGCNAYLTKPIEPCDFFAVLRQHLSRIGEEVSPELERPLPLPTSTPTCDPRFQPLLDNFLARLPGMLDQLQVARAEGEFDTLCTVVHRLRGTATNYGFPEITVAADKCETVLRSESTPEQHLNESLDRLTNLVGMAIETRKNNEEVS
ncbi:MAG: PAS domain S-box protein [Pirellulaceae bacterium]